MASHAKQNSSSSATAWRPAARSRGSSPAPDGYEVTIFGAEPRVNYDRIMLSPVLAGEKTFEDIVINDEAWYRDNGITLHAGASRRSRSTATPRWCAPRRARGRPTTS